MQPERPVSDAEDLAALQRRVGDSFARQAAMTTLGATLGEVAPGRVSVLGAHRAALTQPHGYLHDGKGATALHTACGYAP